MNKKLISIGLTVIMTLTVLSGIAGLSNANPIAYTPYTVNIIVKNYTLPYDFYNYSSFDMGGFGNVIITKYSPTHTLTAYYYGSNNKLDKYIFKTEQFIPLSSFLRSESDLYYILVPNQLLNNSISGIGDINVNNGYVEYDYYNLYNNTNTENTTSILNQTTDVSISFADNYFYYSYATNTNTQLYNVWINMTTHKYYYLNYTILGWNSVDYFNAGKSWMLSETVKANDTIANYVMEYSKSSNSFVEQTMFTQSNADTVYLDYNNQPFVESELSNGTYIVTGSQASKQSSNIYDATVMYYYPSSNTYHFSILYNTNIPPTSIIPFIMNDNNQYTIEGGANFGLAMANQTAFYNFYNETYLLTNNTWFNNYFHTTSMGYEALHNNEITEAYFGFSGWENAISNVSTNKILLWYLPNKVNEFMPSNTSFENNNKHILSIKENGLPTATSWTYNFNGTSYTLTNNSYNYSLVNGNYALSVSSVNGYNVAYPSTITIDNASKIAYVNFSAIPKYAVHIKENGLPSGTSWNFTIKHDSSIIVAETLSTNEYNTSLQNGTYYLYAGSESGYRLNIHTSPFTVSGSAITEYVNYSAIPTYTLYLKESGLSSGTKWIAYVNSVEYLSTNEYMNVSGLNNGTYSISIDNVVDYSLGTYPNSFTINGNNEYINVSFTHNLSLYNLKIIASGIKNIDTITWSVVFNSTTYSSQNSNTIIIPSLKNGSYSFSVNSVSGYITDKYSSTIVISGNTTERIYFNETFRFILHSNLSTTIVFNGSTYTTSNDYVNISNLVNGTYSLSINGISGYSLSAYPSNVIINGNNYYLNITYTKVILSAGHYIVSFVMFGLPSGASWTVVINNIQYYSSGKYLNVSLVNGTYYPDIIIPNGYYINSANILIVNGHNTNYTMVMYPNTVSLLTTNMPYIIIFLFIIFALVIVLLVKRRD